MKRKKKIASEENKPVKSFGEATKVDFTSLKPL